MSFINKLAVTVSEAEKQYRNLLETGSFGNYRREIVYPGKGTDKQAEYSAGSADIVKENFPADIQKGCRRIYHGDNLQLLADGIRSGSLRGSLDMIYCDPPFFTKHKQEVSVEVYCGSDMTQTSGSAVKNGLKAVKLRQRAYSDIWNGDMADYLKMLAVRLFFMRDALKDEGSIFIHLDWHAVHAVKLIMDEIFGEENFINEIIWTYKSGGAAKRHFSRKHDTILFYSKTDKYRFNEQEKEKSYNRGLKPYHFKGVEEFKDETGWYTLVNPRDVWQIDMVGRSSGERLNYANQKPEALLEKMIKAVTVPGALCADFFCGSGTLAAAAAKLGRDFICVDECGLAVSNSLKRPILRGHAFELWSISGSGEKPGTDSPECIGRCETEKDNNHEDDILFSLRPADLEKGRIIMETEPEAFDDYCISGRLLGDGSLMPDRAVFRTSGGYEIYGLTESRGGEDENSVCGNSDGRNSAEMKFDVFGGRRLMNDGVNIRQSDAPRIENGEILM